MTERRFDPVRGFSDLRDNLSKVVESTLRPALVGSFPHIDIYETASALIVATAPLDGLDPSSVNVSIVEGVLWFSGETRPPADEPAGATLLRRERTFGQFSRSVRLPFEVQPEGALARVRQGALTITLPKRTMTGIPVEMADDPTPAVPPAPAPLDPADVVDIDPLP